MEEGEQKVGSAAWPTAGPGTLPVLSRRGAPTTPRGSHTWQRPGPARAAGLSPASPPLPLPCPGKRASGSKESGKAMPGGRRPSSGRRTHLPGAAAGPRPSARGTREAVSGARPEAVGPGRARATRRGPPALTPVHPGR